MTFMKFETILAERKNKAIYKDGDKTIKVFDESFQNQIYSTRHSIRPV